MLLLLLLLLLLRLVLVGEQSSHPCAAHQLQVPRRPLPRRRILRLVHDVVADVVVVFVGGLVSGGGDAVVQILFCFLLLWLRRMLRKALLDIHVSPLRWQLLIASILQRDDARVAAILAVANPVISHLYLKSI